MSQQPIARSWRVVVLLVLIAGLLTVPAFTPSRATPTLQPAQEGLLVNGPNALVTAVTHHAGSGRSYVAGDFTRWGPQTGGMAVVNNTTAALNTGFPAVFGMVRAAVPDGVGGVYIGGTFSNVGGVARSNAAHILADGTVDPNWSPNLEATGWDGVIDMARIGSDVILAGRFTFGGQTVGVTRVGPDGTRTPGFSDVLLGGSGSVYSVATDGSTIFAGGQFATLDGETRGNGAAIDAATGVLGGWDPEAASGPINSVELMDDSIIIGGDFSTVTAGAVIAPNLAAFAVADGSLKADWIPAPDARVTSMAVAEDGSQLYITGHFGSVGESSISFAAGLETDTDVPAVLTGWAPEINGLPFSVQSSNSGVYLTGLFTHAEGQSVPGVARVTAVSGSLDAGWDPPDPAYSTSGGPEYVFVATPLAGSQVLIGGTFTVMGGTPANRVAALDAEGNLITSFSVGDGPDDRVYAMTVADGKLFLGGGFTAFNGQGRSHLAAVNPDTGALDGWGASLQVTDAPVHALAAEGDELFIGGSFEEVNGATRNGLAGLDLFAGSLTGWGTGVLNSGANVRALAATTVDSTRRVYAGGTFTRAGGSDANLAGLDGENGTQITDVPSVDGPVRSLSIAADRLYFGGDFTTVDSADALGMAAIGLSSNTRELWDGAANAGVTAISADADQIVVGGGFDVAFGRSNYGFAAGSDNESATEIDWDVQSPNFYDGTVHAVVLVADPVSEADQRVLIGSEVAIVDDAQIRFYYADVNSAIAAAPPRNVRAVAGGGSGLVDLSWDAPSTLGPGIAEPVGYRVWLSSPPYTTWSLAIGNTEDTAASAVVSGLTNSTRYRFRVAALTDQGDPEPVVGGLSAPSNWAMPQNPARLPSVPQDVTATGEQDGATGMIRVEGDPPASWGNGTAKGYRAVASTAGIPMGYCQTFDEPSVAWHCYITALTLGSNYDVVAKAVNSKKIWGPAVIAGGSPIHAQVFERPIPEPLDPDPEQTDEPLAPGSDSPAPPQERITAPRAPLAKSSVTSLRVRTVKQGRARGKHTVVVRAKVRPAAGRVVHLQRKVCTTDSDQRMCVWKTVVQRRAKAADSGVVVVRSQRAARKAAAWRVFLPATATALPAVSRTIRR